MLTVVLIAAVLLGACTRSVAPGGQNADVALDVAPDTVAAQDSVTLTLSNGSPASIGYNLCTSGLERQGGGGWQAVPEDRVCTMELRTLEPGGLASFTLRLPPDLASGDYRYHTSVEMLDTNTRRDARSDAFRVR
jgi:hypothetical protein